MKRTSIPIFSDRNVAKVFNVYPDDIRARLMHLRGLIFETARSIDDVGRLEETLKWGQPSYLTTQSGSGSTIRIDREKTAGRIAMYFHCQTDLVATFRELYPTEMSYGGNRSILFDACDRIPEKALRHCIGLALTYHLRKNRTPNATTKGKATSIKKTAAIKPRARPS